MDQATHIFNNIVTVLEERRHYSIYTTLFVAIEWTSHPSLQNNTELQSAVLGKIAYYFGGNNVATLYKVSGKRQFPYGWEIRLFKDMSPEPLSHKSPPPSPAV